MAAKLCNIKHTLAEDDSDYEFNLNNLADETNESDLLKYEEETDTVSLFNYQNP